MKIHPLVFVFALSFCLQTAVAQNYVTQSNADSSVRITKDARLDDLVKKQKEQNLRKQTMHGYRVQIYFGNARQKATDVKSEFSGLYPNVASYLTYKQPNYKVRVGDFRTRLEAQKFLKNIRRQYNAAFIVTDDIRLPLIK